MLQAEPAAAPDEKIAQRIYAHLVIQDILSACEEAQLGLKQYPQSKPLQEAYIKALARSGDERTLWKAWDRYAGQFPDAFKNRDILEAMAWGTISTGSASSSPVIRVTALLGAFFGQDAKGVEILCKNMRDTNSLIRAIAVKLVANMRDAKLCDEVLRMFNQEKNWKVRLEAIRAVGSMKLAEARPELVNIIASDQSMAEEKTAAIQSLVELLDTAERDELVRLAKSNRAGLRLLACELIDSFDLVNDSDLLIDLLQDHHADVRTAALHAMGSLCLAAIENRPISDLIERHLNDPDYNVAITAAWALTLNDPERGQKAFQPWLSHESDEVRHFAAGALASTGKYGTGLMLKAFKQSGDQFVRMNLAIGLINQRMETDKACGALYQGLMQSKERWDWNEDGYFKVLVPSKIKHEDAVPNHPEQVNQITRLEVLNVLAIMKFPQAQNAVRNFLQQRTWGITGMAAALLLTEGDESAIDLVKDLLTDSDKKVRMQAALILALWGSGEDAIDVLQKGYETADRDMKERILEGLGRIGVPSTIPFFVEKMREPYQSLRIMAAAALLECLYH